MSKEAKHTPGPWEVMKHNKIADGSYPCIHCCEDAKDGSRSNVICSFSNDYKQAFADANLIAAAPDMLEALRIMVDCTPCQNGCAKDDMSCATRRAEAAIAKAKGG